MKPNDLVSILRETFAKWNQDKASRIAAAVAYYTLFSLAPLLVVLILATGLVLGQAAAQGRLVGQIQNLVGPDVARLIEGMIESAERQRSGGIVATVISLIALLLGALGLFGALQDALNTIWGVQPKPAGSLWATIRTQALTKVGAFVVVLLIGLLLIAAFLVSTALSAVATLFGDAVPGLSYAWFVANFVVSFVIVTALFAIIYKVLPDAEIAWSDVWIGAAFTSLLFVIGKEAIGLYLTHAGVGSIYGAAGSLVVLLVWIYYSAQILLLGAEFTQVYANKYGSNVRPAPNAILVNREPASGGSPQAATPAEPAEREGVPTRRAGLADRLTGAYAPLLVGMLFGWLLGSTRGTRE